MRSSRLRRKNDVERLRTLGSGQLRDEVAERRDATLINSPPQVALAERHDELRVRLLAGRGAVMTGKQLLHDGFPASRGIEALIAGRANRFDLQRFDDERTKGRAPDRHVFHIADLTSELQQLRRRRPAIPALGRVDHLRQRAVLRITGGQFTNEQVRLHFLDIGPLDDASRKAGGCPGAHFGGDVSIPEWLETSDQRLHQRQRFPIAVEAADQHERRTASFVKQERFSICGQVELMRL